MSLFEVLQAYGEKLRSKGRVEANRWLAEFAEVNQWTANEQKRVKESFSDSGCPVTWHGSVLEVSIAKAPI